MECILAIDQGTQSSRALIYDKAGHCVASAQQNFEQIYPQKGWCEHNPDVLIDSVTECIDGALQDAAKKVGDIKVLAVGITNQRETTLVWRRSTGRACYNAVVWLDTRTRDLCHQLSKQWGVDRFRRVTGLPISTYFSCVKIMWLYDNVPDVRAAIDEGDAAVGTVDSWLIYNLTGGVNGGAHVTDVSNASRTGLMDVRTQKWCAECLEAYGIPESCMPHILSNSEEFGRIVDGPLAGLPVMGSLGDQQAALLDRVVWHAPMLMGIDGGHVRSFGLQCKNTYGTGCFVLAVTGTEPVISTHGLLTTVGHKLGPSAPVSYALEGAIGIAGMAVSWLRDQLGVIGSADESESIAAQVPDTGGVYFVPAFGGLLAPHWRDDARGILVGMTSYTNRAHIVRATLESMAFQTRDVLEAMCADMALDAIDKLRVDGGATHNDLLMQMQADIAQVPVERPAFQESTSLGAAFAAGLAIGFYSKDSIFGEEHPAGATLFKPRMSPREAEARYASWTAAVAKSFDSADLV